MDLLQQVRRGRLTRVLVPLLAAAAIPATASAQAEPTLVMHVPVSAAILNPCTGEMLTITGTSTIGMHMSFDAVGGSHMKTSIESRGITGTTVAGVKYVGTQTFEHEHQIPANGNFELTIENYMMLVRQRDDGTFILGDDFRMKLLTHLTFANGALTSVQLHLTDPSRVCN